MLGQFKREWLGERFLFPQHLSIDPMIITPTITAVGSKGENLMNPWQRALEKHGWHPTNHHRQQQKKPNSFFNPLITSCKTKNLFVRKTHINTHSLKCPHWSQITCTHLGTCTCQQLYFQLFETRPHSSDQLWPVQPTAIKYPSERCIDKLLKIKSVHVSISDGKSVALVTICLNVTGLSKSWQFECICILCITLINIENTR